MPTPFTHLAINEQLRTGDALPDDVRALLNAHLPAYLLGSVVADARPNVDNPREATHFYAYDRPMEDHPWRVMLTQFPDLRHPHDDAHRAFIMGYVAHLAVDEIWSLEMLGPHFAFGAWGGTRNQRFYWLHILLSNMDERDRRALPPITADLLAAAQPHDWLPFLPDSVMTDWRDLLVAQLTPGGIGSQTLQIFAGRLGVPVAQLAADAANPNGDARAMWEALPPALRSEVDSHMTAHAQAALLAYAAGA